MNLKTKFLRALFVLAVLGFSFKVYVSSATTTDTTQLSLLEREANYEKEKAEYLQESVLDKILGPGNAIVIVDVVLGIETKTTKQAATEKKVEKKKKLGEMEYLLPGVPNPKSVASEGAPGESRSEEGEAGEVKIEVRTVIKKQTVTILHDDKIGEEKLNAVEEAVIASMKIVKGRDTIEFKKTKFTRGFLEELLKPKILIPVILALLMLLYLFGPFSSFLRSYVRTIKEKGGTEVTVDSKFEGGPEGDDGNGEGGGGGGGKLSAAELEALEEEKKKYHPFNYIDDENLKRLVYLIRSEEPKTIALVISYLKAEHVKEVLSSLIPEVQARVALEMATIRQKTQEEVMAIDMDLKAKIDFLIGGLDHLIKVLDEVDKGTRDNILEYLQNENPELYEKVKQFIITFEDIPSFPDQAMQVVIRELKSESLARALRNASPDVLNKFFANMSANAAAVLKEEMEYGRPLAPEEIDEERKKIVDLIKQLENEGKIFIREKPKGTLLDGLESDVQYASGTNDSANFNEYFDAGVNYYNQGMYEESLAYFEYCTQLNPYNSAVYQYLGGAYYALGRQNDAVSAYEKAYQIEPSNTELKSWLDAQKGTVR